LPVRNLGVMQGVTAGAGSALREAAVHALAAPRARSAMYRASSTLACMRVSWPAKLRDGCAGQRLVQRRLGRRAVCQAAQMVLDGGGGEALLDVAADAGTRILAPGLSPLVFIGGADRGRQGRKPDLRSAIVRSVAGWAKLSPGPAGGGWPSLFQPAVVGRGAGEVAAGDVGPAGAVAAGLACASAAVVTGPAELPFSQADQDCCQ
jgi:hypothetical protein